jgi:hypothetical protein
MTPQQKLWLEGIQEYIESSVKLFNAIYPKTPITKEDVLEELNKKK